MLTLLMGLGIAAFTLGRQSKRVEANFKAEISFTATPANTVTSSNTNANLRFAPTGEAPGFIPLKGTNLGSGDKAAYVVSGQCNEAALAPVKDASATTCEVAVPEAPGAYVLCYQLAGQTPTIQTGEAFRAYSGGEDELQQAFNEDLATLTQGQIDAITSGTSSDSWLDSYYNWVKLQAQNNVAGAASRLQDLNLRIQQAKQSALSSPAGQPQEGKFISQGKGTVCRHFDDRDGYGQIAVRMPNLQACQNKCKARADCHGIEYRASTKRCEIWRMEIRYSLNLIMANKKNPVNNFPEDYECFTFKRSPSPSVDGCNTAQCSSLPASAKTQCEQTVQLNCCIASSLNAAAKKDCCTDTKWPLADHRKCSPCGEAGKGCFDSACCKNKMLTCYVQNSEWADCRDSCQVGQVDLSSTKYPQSPWSCKGPDSCASQSVNCMQGMYGGSCCDYGMTCFMKNTTFGQCKRTCDSVRQNVGEDQWSCEKAPENHWQ